MERDAIEKIIVDAYINGIHGNQDEKAIRKGFHEDFCMLVLAEDGDNIQKVTVEKWLQIIDGMKTKNPELWKGKTTHTFKLIDNTGNAACVKIEVYKNNNFFSTDYMLLYKFKDGWKIVSKIFR